MTKKRGRPRKYQDNAAKQRAYRDHRAIHNNVTKNPPMSVRVPAPNNRLVSGGMGTRQLDIISGAARGAAHGSAVNADIPRYTGPQTFALAELCGLDPKEQFFKEMAPWFTALVNDLMGAVIEAAGSDCDSHMAIQVVNEAATRIVKEEMAKPEGGRAWQDF